MSDANNPNAQNHEMVVAGANADADIDADHDADGWEYPVNSRRIYRRYMVNLMR
jgi:hypothetical protein